MKLSFASSLLFTSLFVGAAAAAATTVGTSSSIHLRGGQHRDDLSSSQQGNDEIVTVSSFLVIDIVDVPMDDLSLEDRADFNYAFQQAFDTIHGDRDGLYLSGEQIDGINNVNAEESSSDIITARRRRRRQPRWAPKKSRYYNKWDIYLHVDMSGRCNMCRDDDAVAMMEEDAGETETSLLQLLLGNNKKEQEASDYVFEESNLDAVADEFCRLLKDSSGNKRFKNAKMCDIFMLSETDYTTALTTIASTTNSIAAATSTATATATANDNDTPEEEEEDNILPTDSESSDSSASTVSLPYFYGNQETSNKIKAADGIVGTGFLKITVNGIEMQQRNGSTCGVWHTADLFDFSAAIHTAFNAIHGTTTDGIYDAGQTIDKIKCVRGGADAASAAVVVEALGRRNKSLWGDHFEIYLAIDMSGGKKDGSSSYLSEASLRDIADAASDDLIRFGNPHFRRVIDLSIENLTKSDYYEAEFAEQHSTTN
ncbi:hypothetical protein FRACYDRAFT_240746 [Fragilariopsis cylindrus CCMP1102]|uniref:Uncharacterized protein n=1 Tax=Fragilariopsis cylindrus CCMP1102 TaxID=635003 RepID=A0A1E7F7N9_9STRA|nr:hypothetical protein FRACYDRAFT_240746 [Fragilariopsis cylindrus CCMP1102]|eukprot:OEU14212.1 hypothetical protein FRACYDRAFT_240746 [Fragilariopsis cylindrus CCMP1102]